MFTARVLTLSSILFLVLASAFVPAHATFDPISRDSLAICSSEANLQTLGVEGGLLSLLTSRSNPASNPVAEIIANGTAVIAFAGASSTTRVAFQPKTC